MSGPIAGSTPSAEPKSRGWKRHHELKRQDAVDKRTIIDGLVAELGRSATMSDMLAIEDLASLVITARIYDRRGNIAKAAETRAAINKVRKGSNLKPQPITPKSKPVSIADRWRQNKGTVA
jgi:hypothetical protein